MFDMNKYLHHVLVAGILLLCFTALPGFTTGSEADNGTITGKVINDSTVNPVSFASVALLNAIDSSLLILFGGEKKFSDKFSVDVFYNPFIRDFMYSKVVTTTPGYQETCEGQVEVSHLFCCTLHYNFNRGGSKINKIDRAVEYEKNEGKGGL
jgi:hypothetical protein